MERVDCIRVFNEKLKSERQAQIKKQQDKDRRQWNKDKKVILEKLKTLSQIEQEARKEFQKYIRLRDRNLPCISCNISIAKQWDAGHYLKAELFSGLIFNEDNCHKQCSTCNNYKSGNELEYRDGLIRRYGLQYVLDLEALKPFNRSKKYTRQELYDIKKIYVEKLKRESKNI